jgi:hypothetical protein
MIVHLWPRPWLTQNHKWEEALDKEYSSIFKNNIRKLTNLPLDRALIYCKWILFKKHIVNAILGHHRAQLITHGFSEHYKFNYEETF